MGSLKRLSTKLIPWKEIATSCPVWALVACQIGHDWGFFVMAIDLPKYMNDVLQFSVAHNGFYSSLPFLFMWISSISVGFLGDALIKHGVMSITNCRKLMTAIGKYDFIFIGFN